MLIYIPSHARATEANIRMGPLLQMTRPWQARTHYVVPHGQLDAYSNVLHVGMDDLVDDVSILETPEGLSGIADTRRWIAEHARSQGEGKLVMMDDDVGFLIRKAPDDWRLVAQSDTDVAHMLDMMDLMLDEHAMVGISSREGNNRPGVGHPRAENMVAINTRIMRVFGIDVEKWLAMEHGRVEVMEDFDLTLQLLRAGYTNANLFYWANGQKMTNMAGGCSTYRSHEVQDRSARRLAELHPGLVRLRQKENKTDREGLGTRTEVTIMWKKAAEQGQVNRG